MKAVLATGGSGGHLFPAIKVADHLKSLNYELLFVGSFKIGQEHIEKNGYEVQTISAVGMGSGIKLFRSVGLMIWAWIESIKILLKFKPDVVIGFGGYGSFPIILAAVILRCPTMIHEQNVVPGKANKVLNHFVKKVAISFKKSESFFNQKKIVLTGCPSKAEKCSIKREELYLNFGLQEDTKTILVLGGSQGSHFINQMTSKVFSKLIDTINFQVIHLCGKDDYNDIKSSYHKTKIQVAVIDFLDDIEQAYELADLVVARSGALTICELAKFKVPSILIPYPHAQGHQKENAKLLSEINMARVIEEYELTDEILIQEVKKMLSNNQENSQLEEEINRIFISNPAQRIAEEAVALVS